MAATFSRNLKYSKSPEVFQNSGKKTGINSCYTTTLSKGERIGSVASYSDSKMNRKSYPGTLGLMK